MATGTFYLAKEFENYIEQWQAIKDKGAWIRQKLDEDANPLESIKMVPRPPELSTYRWNQHLQDSGFEVVT